jgi:archaellum component FlaC
MEARITRLEGSVEDLRGDVSEIKTDIRELRGDTQRLLWAGIGAMGLVIGGAWMMYSKLSADINTVQDKLSAENSQLGNKLADLQATVEHIAGYLDGQQHPGPKSDIPTATAPGAPRH